MDGMTKDIVQRLKKGGGLICNFPVNESFVPAKRLRAHVEYWDNSELTAERLVAYALEHHKIEKENQTYSEVYDSYKLFSDMVTAGGDVCAGGDRVSGGAPGNGVPAADDQEQKQQLVLAMISVLRTRQRELAVLPAPRRPSVLVRWWRKLTRRRK